MPLGDSIGSRERLECDAIAPPEDRTYASLNMDSAKSLNTAYLVELYAMSGVVRAYVSAPIAREVERFVNQLHENYAEYEKKQNDLHGNWFEGEPEYTFDGVYCGMREILINDDYEGYERDCERLASKSALDAKLIHEALTQVSNLIREEIGLKALS